ncbi:HNH endonuclease [Myxococcus sp. NMCA1]|uniref:HNH endonuclease n=1 Tax=Myxococcus sp. NMCA1 TaxID=2996785 RepID=UPI002286A537|nr:HNH endonuclease [Myxococcus sp. NMCA1]WAM26804.1 hypothetical protein OZ403_01405 [Myxococcus sp. NMCA1]
MTNQDIDWPIRYQGETLNFANRARGIFWPRHMRETALSIKTTVPRQGREARYDDLRSNEGFQYRFQGTDVASRDNRRLARGAAHILPDRDERGRPEVSNGLSLCKLHHGAFDTDLLGIRPDGIIEIAPRLLAERDGPTLEYGLKGFAGKALGILPEAPAHRPRREYLEARYERFREAG